MSIETAQYFLILPVLATARFDDRGFKVARRHYLKQQQGSRPDSGLGYFRQTITRMAP